MKLAVWQFSYYYQLKLFWNISREAQLDYEFEDKSHDEEHYKNQKQKEQRNFQLFSGKSMFIDTFQC